MPDGAGAASWPRPNRSASWRLISSAISRAQGHIVIAAGGGGIPVEEVRPGIYRGVEAVIDKDLASVVLAAAVQATRLIIVTAVDHVFLNFGTAHERPLRDLTAAEAQRHLDEGQFPAGSMGPKISGAVRFLAGGRPGGAHHVSPVPGRGAPRRGGNQDPRVGHAVIAAGSAGAPRPFHSTAGERRRIPHRPAGLAGRVRPSWSAALRRLVAPRAR